MLAAYAGKGTPALSGDLLDWAQRLADELARFWDHQALLERNLRMSRYRDAQRTIQRALLDQPDPEAVFRTLAQSLVDIAGAAAVDVHVVDDDGPFACGASRWPGRWPMRCARLSADTWTGPAVGTPLPMQALLQARAADPHAATAITTTCRRRGGSEPLDADGRGRGAGRSAGTGEGRRRRRCRRASSPSSLARRMPSTRRCAAAGGNRRCRRACAAPARASPGAAGGAAAADLSGAARRADRAAQPARPRHASGMRDGRAERSDRLVAAGLLDLDDLKPINDRYGHAMGDRLLVEVATAAAPGTACGRLRGPPGRRRVRAGVRGHASTRASWTTLLERRVAGIAPSRWRSTEPSSELAASLGIALFPTHVKGSGEQLLRRADQAMYEMKARKRQRERWWSLPLASGGTASRRSTTTAAARAPYGESRRARCCGPGWRPLSPRLPGLVEAFRAELRAHEGHRALFAVLPPSTDLEAAWQSLDPARARAAGSCARAAKCIARHARPRRAFPCRCRRGGGLVAGGRSSACATSSPACSATWLIAIAAR